MEFATQEHTFVCNCKKQVTVTLAGIGCFHVGEAEEVSGGWRYVILPDGEHVWLCPSCLEKAIVLAKQMISLIGTDEFIIRTLAKKEDLTMQENDDKGKIAGE